MRLTVLPLLLLALLQAPAGRRTPAAQEPADLAVIEFSWNDYVNDPERDRDLYVNPIQAGDAELNEREQHRPPYNRTLPPILNNPRQGRRRTPRHVKGFHYKATFRNDGAKAIRSVEWDYVFIDPEAGKEVARHTFESRRAIKPGRSREFVHFSVVPPTKVVSAEALGSGRGHNPFTERVIVKRVVYADRTSWQRP